MFVYLYHSLAFASHFSTPKRSMINFVYKTPLRGLLRVSQQSTARVPPAFHHTRSDTSAFVSFNGIVKLEVHDGSCHLRGWKTMTNEESVGQQDCVPPSLAAIHGSSESPL